MKAVTTILGIVFLLLGIGIIAYLLLYPDQRITNQLPELENKAKVCCGENTTIINNVFNEINQVKEQVYFLEQKIIERVRVIEIIRDRFKSCQNDSCHFYIRHIPKPFFNDLPGKYYLVELKNIKTQDRVLFPEAQYEVDVTKKNVGESLERFRQEIKVLAQHGINFKLFTRGNADNKGAGSKIGMLSEHIELDNNGELPIYIHKNIGTNLYEKNLSRIEINRHFSNEELPNLRGWFFKNILEEYVDNVRVGILEGSVEKEEGEIFRNSAIILYVEDWKLSD